MNENCYHLILQQNKKLQILKQFQITKIEKYIKRAMQVISQMNQRLSQMNSIFTQNTSSFLYSINLHQTKFTHKDVEDFDTLLTKIKKQVNQQITQFFNLKLQQHSENYQSKINKYSESSQQLHFQLFSFKNELQRYTIQLKQQQQRNQTTLEHFSKKFYINSLKKKHLYAFKQNVQQMKKQKSISQQADSMYKKNLIKKVYFPWRSLTYKQGHSNTIVRQTQQDIQNIHSQYSSIINILKAKIQDTDELIKLKKAAKGQFAYALSKNLMKTISNLSLQVMSLNQISLNDGQYDKSQQDQNLMKQIDKIIQQKVRKVNQYKQNITKQVDDKGGDRQRKIRFV